MFQNFLLLSLSMVCVLQSASVCAAAEPQIRIGLIGDSTGAEQSGWGPAFGDRFNEHAEIINYAKNGATLQALSSKLDALVELEPDYVLIQFGHNDQKRYDTAVYSDHLRSYVERIRKAGGKAVIVSSVTRRSFDAHGKIVSNLVKNEKYSYKGTLTEYANAAEAVAGELDLPFIDLHRASIAHHNKIGREESMSYNFKEGGFKILANYSLQDSGERKVISNMSQAGNMQTLTLPTFCSHLRPRACCNAQAERRHLLLHFKQVWIRRVLGADGYGENKAGLGGLIHRPSTRQVEGECRIEAGLRGDDPAGHGGEFVEGAAAFHRDLVGHVLHLLRLHVVDQSGADYRRRQTVHRDAGLGIRLAYGFHQADHAGFAGRVTRHAGVAFLAGDRGDEQHSTLSRCHPGLTPF